MQNLNPITAITISGLLLTGIMVSLPAYSAQDNQTNAQSKQAVVQNNSQATAAKQANPLPSSVELIPLERHA